MKKIIFSFVLTLAVIIGMLLIYIYSGSYNVSQLVPHNALTKWAVTTTMHRSIDKRFNTQRWENMGYDRIFCLPNWIRCRLKNTSRGFINIQSRMVLLINKRKIFSTSGWNYRFPSTKLIAYHLIVSSQRFVVSYYIAQKTKSF